MPQDSMTTSYKMAGKSRMVYINCEIIELRVHDLLISTMLVPSTWPKKAECITRVSC